MLQLNPKQMATKFTATTTVHIRSHRNSNYSLWLPIQQIVTNEIIELKLILIRTNAIQPIYVHRYLLTNKYTEKKISASCT